MYLRDRQQNNKGRKFKHNPGTEPPYRPFCKQGRRASPPYCESMRIALGSLNILTAIVDVCRPCGDTRAVYFPLVNIQKQTHGTSCAQKGNIACGLPANGARRVHS
jgi:hypothetical protein